MKLLIAVIGIAAGALAAARAQAPLDRLAWMGGCWQAGSASRTVIEMWMPPAGGMMLGASRTVAGGQVREFEQLRIRAEGDGLVYTAVPSGQRETDFRSVAVTDSGFVVENLQHDFPQRIIYRRTGPDGMTARVEGPGSDGVRGFDFVYRRVPCEASGQ
jgi:hypothetical protein